jgi:hypothetical protein
LRERQTAKLIEAGKAFDLAIPAVSRHTPAENVPRQMVHQLRKNKLPCVHGSLREIASRRSGKNRKKFKSITSGKGYFLRCINSLYRRRQRTLGHQCRNLSVNGKTVYAAVQAAMRIGNCSAVSMT